MRSLEWTAPARQDLDNIIDWLRREERPEVGVSMLSAIGERAAFLLDYPMGGPLAVGRDFKSLKVLHTPCLLIFRIKPTTIQILRIRHVREDWRGA